MLLCTYGKHASLWRIVKMEITNIALPQPEHASDEEITRELLFEGMINHGLEDVRAGRVLSNNKMAEGNLQPYRLRQSAAAGKVVHRIYEYAQLLSNFPKLGYKYREEPKEDIPILLYGHYRIPYLSTDAAT